MNKSLKEYVIIRSFLFLIVISYMSIVVMQDVSHTQLEQPNPQQIPAQEDTQQLPQKVLSSTSSSFVIDHTSVEKFDDIPDEYIDAARTIPMVFSDRSVGANINDGLTCLASTSWLESPSHCRRDYTDSTWNWKTFGQNDLDQGVVPERIMFDAAPGKYNRDNWTFELKTGDWNSLTQDFVEVLAPSYINSKDVLSYQFSYLNVETGDTIADSDTGFFSDNPDKYDIYDLEAYMAQHPDKTFILWTTSLSRSIGTDEATEFNNRMRQYAQDNNMILFDVADIESHTDQGVPCYDNRDGVEYCSSEDSCENHPEDGIDRPAICQDYTTETDGGHLGSVSAGKIAIAKAFWVLMAQVAGWDGASTNNPTPTYTPVPTPSSCDVSNADANCDGQTNTLDFMIWARSWTLGAYDLQADFDESGTVDMSDFYIWQNNY